MKRAALVLAALVSVGCNDYGVEPSGLYPGYFLSKVDDQLLPVPYGTDGSVLLAGSLAFGTDQLRPHRTDHENGTVSYTLLIRHPEQSNEHTTIELDYAIENDVLHINLCPPLALCIASTELVGTIQGRYEELVLTHYLGGNPGTVYRFFPALPD